MVSMDVRVWASLRLLWNVGDKDFEKADVYLASKSSAGITFVAEVIPLYATVAYLFLDRHI